MEWLGDMDLWGRFAEEYARSRRWKTLSSVPFVVRLGFVIGAEITLLAFPLSPWFVVPTGIGVRGEGPSLWYGTDRSFRSGLDPEDWRGRFFLRPNRLSIVCSSASRCSTWSSVVVKENEGERV